MEGLGLSAPPAPSAAARTLPTQRRHSGRADACAASLRQSPQLRPSVLRGCNHHSVFLLAAPPKPDFRLPTRGVAPAQPWMCLQEDLAGPGSTGAACRFSDRCDCRRTRSSAAEVNIVSCFQPFVEALVGDGAGHIWSAAADRLASSVRQLYQSVGCWRRSTSWCEKPWCAPSIRTPWSCAPATVPHSAPAMAITFPELPQARLGESTDRYCPIWGRDPRPPRSGCKRLHAGLRFSSLVSTGAGSTPPSTTAWPHGVPADPPPRADGRPKATGCLSLPGNRARCWATDQRF